MTAFRHLFTTASSVGPEARSSTQRSWDARWKPVTGVRMLRPPRDRDASVRPPRHRRANRGSFRLRAPGRRLLRADRVEQDPDPRGPPLLHLRAPIGATAATREAASAPRVRLAGAGLARLLPRSRRARRDADRAARRTHAS